MVSSRYHPLNVIQKLYSIGYRLEDLLPAYPGRTVEDVDVLMADNSNLLNRQVISYGLLGIRPCRTQYFNVSEQGFRHSYRLQQWPPPQERKTIFCFGGSTALGCCLADSETIPARLQHYFDTAGLPVEVYNFGAGSYTSRHEALRYLSLIDSGVVPDIAIFLDGFNDCYFAPGNTELVDTFDYLYSRERKRWRAGFWGRFRMGLASLFDSSLQSKDPSHFYAMPELMKDYEWLFSDEYIVNLLKSSNERDLSFIDSSKLHKVGSLVWERYLNSAAAIAAISARYKVVPLWFWQPVPLFAASEQQRLVERVYLAYRQSAFSALVYRWLEQVSYQGAPANFCNLSKLGEGLDGVLYVDHGHYTPFFADIIAREIFSVTASKHFSAETSQSDAIRAEPHPAVS